MLQNKDYIIKKFQEGDEAAYKEIFKCFHKPLCYFANELIDSNCLTEDFVAIAFVKLWERRVEFKSLLKIKAFLYVATRHACYNHLKHLRRKKISHEQILFTSDDYEEFIEAKIIKAELMQSIIWNLKKLPPDRRKIFDMFYFQGIPVKKIADALGITVDTVRVQKSRAINFLKTQIT